MSPGVRNTMKLISLAAVPILLGAAAAYALTGTPAGEKDHEVIPAALMPPPPPPPPAPAPPPHPQDRHDRHVDRGSRAWLGVTLDTDDDGVMVRSVVDGSPAEKAGVEKGDRIVGIDGRDVNSYSDLHRGMRDLKPGARVALVVERAGRETKLDVTLGESPMRRRIEIRGGDDANVFVFGGPTVFLGVEVHPMSRELRRAFNAPEDAGVLVNRVVKDSSAEQGGIQPGDVIISVAGETVNRSGDIRRALREREAGESVPVRLIRDRGERTIDVILQESSERGSGWPVFLSPDEGVRAFAFSMPDGEDFHFEFSDEDREAFQHSMEQMKERLHETMEQLHEQMLHQKLELRDQQLRLREQLRELENHRLDQVRRVKGPTYDI